MRYPTLKKVLTYKNPRVVERFALDFSVSKKESQVIFKDMLRYLWLCIEAEKEGGEIEAFTPYVIVDEMLHAFILHADDYMKFCMKFYGEFIYHAPNPDKIVKGKTTKVQVQKRQNQYDYNLERVWFALGPAVARRWFFEYPKKYTRIKIKKLQLKAVS